METEEAPESKVEDSTLPEETTETPEVTENSTVETSAVEEVTEVTVDTVDTEEVAPTVEEVAPTVEEVLPVNPLAVGNFDKLFATKAEAEAKAMEQVKLEGGEWFNATFKVTEVEMTDGTVQYGVDFTAPKIVQNELETTPQVLTVNKEKLKETYNLAISLEEQNYSVHSWSNLMFKVADAKQVFDNLATNQQQIDDTVLNLQQAINDLV